MRRKVSEQVDEGRPGTHSSRGRDEVDTERALSGRVVGSLLTWELITASPLFMAHS